MSPAPVLFKEKMNKWYEDRCKALAKEKKKHISASRSHFTDQNMETGELLQAKVSQI